ncbi:MAG TPA: helix-turn-helix transcriptional regulator [Pseudonocardiaceae bacterium]
MRRSLAARLRQLRLDAELTTTELGRATGISQGKISKIETGAQSARVDHVDAWAHACNADDQTRAQLLELAETALAEASAWRREHRAGLVAKQAQVARLEQRAARLRDFQSALVPGLLQTRAYAAAVLGLANLSQQRDLDAAVTARIARQRILKQPYPKIEFIVTEAALVWSPPASDQLWQEQRERLVDAAIVQQVQLGVLPSAAPGPPRLNAFTIYDFADTGEQLVVVETFGAEMYHDDPRDVAVYVEVFDALAANARFGEAAAELVRASG